MLYRQVVPGAVGTSGAAGAEADKKSSARIKLQGGAPGGRPLPISHDLCSLRTVMLAKYCTTILILVLIFFSGAIGVPADTPRSDRHVVVVVWDGMRPDFVSEQTTPTLWKLAREGVTFRNHHAVYPSATQVNGTAMMTGVYPGRSGVIANYAYRPEIDRARSLSVESPTVVGKGDKLSGGKYISVPTIAELVQRAGGRTAIAAAKTVGLLLDRQVWSKSSEVSGSASSLGEGERMEVRGSTLPGNGKAGTLTLPSPLRRERRTSSRNANDMDRVPFGRGVTLFAGQTLPHDSLTPIIAALGPFPSAHLQRDGWTTKAVADLLWKDGLPTLSVIWLGQPDLTEHESAPGAPPALAAIKSSDENLAAVLSALDQQGARNTTDIFVVSDHGFSTIGRSVDLRKILSDAGFAAKTEFDEEPKPGDIMLVGNGGSVLFYVIGRDAMATRRLVEFLQQSDFAGVIFTKQGLPGTFHLNDAKIENPHAPDVVMAFHWDDSKNQFDAPGMIDADWQREAGEGTHATLSRSDMHNTLIAAGPDFPRGQTDDLPTGNVDLAPTILRILGIKASQEMDGRVLSEAMVSTDRGLAEKKTETKTIEAKKDFPAGTWRQSLRISRVGSTIYLDEGNGTFVPR
ncbi:MAG TPA: alkaline phosphatase family protein [Candidatus Udaeobacter sp.]|nr:alkaline phosphatase family protein [Candidatus Udaeobacter sp.]